jgi:ferritin-like metal-binding protein YciE
MCDAGNFSSNYSLRRRTKLSSQQSNFRFKIMSYQTLKDLLVEELKDLYSAETQLLKALPKMAKAAENEELKTAFKTHLEETAGQVERLETIMRHLDESPKGRKCVAMEGLVKEGKEVIDEDGEPVFKDLALIVAAQKVEHYEIAGYGSARTLADLYGDKKISRLLQQTLDEEGKTDKLLTQIASELNVETVTVESGE